MRKTRIPERGSWPREAHPFMGSPAGDVPGCEAGRLSRLRRCIDRNPHAGIPHIAASGAGAHQRQLLVGEPLGALRCRRFTSIVARRGQLLAAERPRLVEPLPREDPHLSSGLDAIDVESASPMLTEPPFGSEHRGPVAVVEPGAVLLDEEPGAVLVPFGSSGVRGGRLPGRRRGRRRRDGRRASNLAVARAATAPSS